MSQSQRRPKRPSAPAAVRVKADSQSSVDEGACTVCHESIELFAVGHCDHPICYKCSTRMRTLCDQFYCAICRADMPKVLFVKALKKFDSFKLDSFCIFREKGLFFENESIKSAFEKLLENRCGICRENFNSFKELETHLKRIHERHFCDLCVDNLKLFSCDRKFYERRQLAEHKRLGDADDKSYRQHPLCKFCDIRYFDNDELLRHLRKDHFFCHFCESDGLTNEYFQEYSFLQNHFREKHFLCEQDGCANVEFVNAFRSKIDLKAHVSKFHGSNLGRQQARQLRAIEVDFNYGPRPNAMGRRPHDRQRGGRGGASGFADRQGGRNQLRRNENQRHSDDLEKRLETDAALALSLSLAEAQRQGSMCLMDPRLAQQSLMTQSAEALEKTEKDFKVVSDDFPILHGQEKSSVSAANGGKESRTGNSDTMAKVLALGVGHSVGNSRLNEAEFPELGIGKSSSLQKASGVWNKGGSLPEASKNKSSVAEKAPGKVLKNNVKPDSFSISGIVASFGSEWTSVGSQSKNSSASRPSSGFHKSRTDPNLSDFPILGKPSNDVGASWVKNKEAKLPDQPQAKKKQEGLTKLETKKKAEKHSDCEEVAVQGSTGINGRGVNEFGGENGGGRKEAVKSLADIASLLTGNQTESKAAHDEALPADSSGPDKKSRKKNNDNRAKNDRELSATKKDASQEGGKADNRTKKETLKQNVMFCDNREDKKDKDLRQEDAVNRKRSKNKGNEKTSTPNLKQSQLVKKLSDERSSGDVSFKEKPKTEFGVHSVLTAADIGTSVLLSKPPDTDSELDKSDGFKTGKPEDVQKTDSLNDISHLPVIEADFSLASKESCIDYNDIEDGPKFLPSDFPSLDPNSLGIFSTGYSCNPLPGSFPFGQIDIEPDVAINSLLVSSDIPSSHDPGLSIVGDTSSSNGAGLSLPTPPPGFTIATSKPPPGFAPMGVKPPPGFSQPLTTDADKLTNDSLSNLLDQYSAVPSYKPPKQFRERVAKFAEILSESTGNSFAQFSLLSHEFQSNLITAGDYYRKCSEVMDSEAFRRVFPELVALMPSIERQRELLKVHRMHLSEESKDIRKGWKPWSCPTDGLVPCSYCGQIILNDDSLDHMTEHESQDFPLLK